MLSVLPYFVTVYQEELMYVCAQLVWYESTYITWRHSSACSVEVSDWLHVLSSLLAMKQDSLATGKDTG